MNNTNVKFSLIVENLVPEYVREEFPLVIEFLKQYYTSIENQGQTLDIIQNIHKYVQIDHISNLVSETKLISDVSFFETELFVSSVRGFPAQYGLLQIGNEVITYESLEKYNKVENIDILIPNNSDLVYPTNVVSSLDSYVDKLLTIKDDENNIVKSIKIVSVENGNSLKLNEVVFVSDIEEEKKYKCDINGNRFLNCKRGFSGVTSYNTINNVDRLTFTETEAEDHSTGDVVKNLSILFLKEFFKKLKYQIAPGFENLNFFSELNESTFVKNLKQFYSSKGTDCSFEILFRALFGSDVEVIKPRDYLIIPSESKFNITKDLVVESISGNPLDLVNKTLYQDKIGNIPPAKGIVSNVEKIRRNDKDYYVISLDYLKENYYDTIYGEFSIHPKTRITTKCFPNQTYIDVDSTIGFSDSGELILEYDNGTTDIVTYKNKTSTQFTDCTGITQVSNIGTEIKYNTFAYGTKGSEIISVRISGVLSDLNLLDNSYYNIVGDEIEIKTLGKEIEGIKANNWFFNIPISYNVEYINLLDNAQYEKDYEVRLIDDHILRIGDPVTLTSSLGVSNEGLVVSILNEKSIIIRIKNNVDETLIYKLIKNVSKVNCKNYPELNQYSTNVQNVYEDPEGNLYVNSQSLPNYLYEPLLINDRSVLFSGQFNNTETLIIGSHGFYTGDSVIYYPGEGNNTLNISKGIYFVKKIDENTIKLSRSRNNIYTNNFIKVSGNIIDNKITLSKFSSNNLIEKKLKPQNIIKKISTVSESYDETTVETTPGTTGIFINGVELLNYKSEDRIFYGKIKSIIPKSSGTGYSLINPPIIEINDPVGFGAIAHCSTIGSLERVDIIDPGFDYIETPQVEIIGGGGDGASVSVKMNSFSHSVTFNKFLINLNDNKIGFTTYHKFRNHEKVIYNSLNQIPVEGLIENSSYYVGIVDELNIKLYKSFNDSVSGINTISLVGYGGENHKLTSSELKRKIGSIDVVSTGTNYKNRKRICFSSGISTYSDTISIENHGYSSGEIITYESNDIPALGLQNNEKYFVTKLDENSFKLSKLNQEDPVDLFYNSKQYINIKSSGRGKHTFNYPKIEIKVTGKVGTFSTTQNYQALLSPIFTGEIDSVFVENGGKSYGSQEILNYVKQPEINLLNGTNAQISPIVSNGKIVDVIIKNTGKNYNSPPRLEIIGSGKGAVLTPIVKNGLLTEVKIISSGSGYSNTTLINVYPSGSGAKFEALIESWRINLVERLFRNNRITTDDGVIYEGKSKNSALEYTHLYAPRKLRSSVLGSKSINGRLIFTPDLELIDGKETLSSSHSPIIGWAYDGNPIYGPYGYASVTGGKVIQMTSGYEMVVKENRPDPTIYPLGVFIEDYEFLNTGTLDKHNGRYCTTPEFPNGVYAYFCTVNPNTIETTGPFFNYKKPSFPYVIGNVYKSKPINFNLFEGNNLNNFNINDNGWIRNTTPYNLLKDNSEYTFIENSNSIKKQISKITSIGKGSVENINILSGGYDYKVNDKIIFNNENTKGFGSKSIVSFIKGVDVENISTEKIEELNVEFVKTNTSFIGFSTKPHNFLKNDIVTITSQYDYNKNGIVDINNNTLILNSNLDRPQNTGIVTYVNVSGNLNYPIVKENDIYQLNNETIKILNIEKDNSRIRVLRNIDQITGITTHFSGSILKEKTNKIYINFYSSGISTVYNNKVNREFYFNPVESVGLGNTFGVGINSTLYFSNPGTGNTSITIPTKSIYIPNHNLETGDEIVYYTNGGNPLKISYNGVNNISISNGSIFYVVKIDSNTIGISSNRLKLGSSGNLVNVQNDTISNTVFFIETGTGQYHSFKTRYNNVLTGSVSKKVSTVVTKFNHLLSLNDTIELNVKSKKTKTLKLKYNKQNRRVLVNPIDFDSNDINLINNTIYLPDHKLKNGQKIIHTSTSPCGGLINNEMYFIHIVDRNTVKLCDSKYESLKIIPSVIDITSTSFGTISPINPEIQIIRDETIIFDLSDSSLSFENNSKSYPAFELVLYKNSNFTDRFESTGKGITFNVERIGKVGIDTNASLIISSTSDIDFNLYYNLIPIDLKINDPLNVEIFTDNEIDYNNRLNFINSKYNGNHSIVGISSTSYSFNIFEDPEEYEYNLFNSTINYKTNSKTAKGSISDIKLISGGYDYETLPSISSVSSETGYGAILKLSSESIGTIKKYEILDIGFNYSSDYSIRPTAIQPLLIEVDNISIVDKIDIVYPGKNYNIPPKLILIDGFTNEIVKNIELNYDIKNNRVDIIKNTTGVSEYSPKIVSINNTNGFDIRNVEYNQNTKNVTITLNSGFSFQKDFPFNIGDRVFVENVSVGVSSLGKGFNSSNYNYSTFKIISVDKNISGSGGSIVYNISEFLNQNEYPGIFDPFNSSGKVIPEKYLPIFDVKLKKNEFFVGEILSNGDSAGTIQSIDLPNNIIKVLTKDKFVAGDLINGKSSNTFGIIKSVKNFNSEYVINSNAINRKNWDNQIGFLNNDLQRIHDSDYYQYFSYDLKSEVSIDKWDSYVDNLNHTSGFKKFSNLIIPSTPPNYTGISTEQNQSEFFGISDVYEVIDLNCYHDFDLVKENIIRIDDDIKSNELSFNGKILQDYIESSGNKVLTIDNITDSFNSNPRVDNFSVVDSFPLNEICSKYIIFIQDKIFNDFKQTLIVSLLQNKVFGYINQYGRIENIDNLGYFDFNVTGSSANLLFYPKKFEVNVYDVQFIKFNFNESISGIGQTSLGNIVNIESFNVSLESNSNKVISTIPIASKGAKILVQIGSVDQTYYEFNEITLVHNGTDVEILDYGQFNSSSLSNYSGTGIGTYSANIIDDEIVVNFTPNISSDVDFYVNTTTISLGTNDVEENGLVNFIEGIANSDFINIPSNPSPSSTIICNIDNDCKSSYFIILVEDIDNNQTQISELVILKDQNELLFTEYGILTTDNSLGTYSTEVSNNIFRLIFTPNPNIDVKVTYFQISLGRFEEQYANSSLNLNNVKISSGYGEYFGTLLDIRKDFELTHKGNPIFVKKFNGQDSSIVDINNNSIKIPYHYFVTGEEIEYSYKNSDVSTENAITISPTFISGIGVTNKLPKTLYIVKDNDFSVRVSASASQSLKQIPEVLDFQTVGIGSNHSFISKSRNERVLVSIDNVIQSPIVLSPIRTGLTTFVNKIDTYIEVENTENLFGGDLIKINTEIMRIKSVNFPKKNSILIERPLLGSIVKSHEIGSNVVKISGNYNIENNRIYFTEPPFGKIPFSNPNGRPDEIDYKGLEISSRFNGRVFLRSGITNSNQSAYSNNKIIDNISDNFNTENKNFIIKSSDNNITGISSDNAIILINSIFQPPTLSYILNENSGITTLSFVAQNNLTNYDSRIKSIPKGGIILSVGSSEGFGYHPLISAGGTAIVSPQGSIQSINLFNNGSGYRVGIQTIVNVNVMDSNSKIVKVGIASITNGKVTNVNITNPGTGYSQQNPPKVIIDSPLSYNNIPLVYSSTSSGVGTGAKINVIVGQKSNIIDFEITNLGYGYKKGDVLTLPTGGNVGIPTEITPLFEEFKIQVESTFNDSFSGWLIGSLELLDSIESLFDGVRKRFPISIDSNVISIIAKKGSNIEVKSVIFVFINDILQVPDEGYIFNGGSIIEFTEAPKPGDKCSIVFYGGTKNIDTKFVDVLETVKPGDTLRVNSDNFKYQQKNRLVESIPNADLVKTNLYSDQGIDKESLVLRPVLWCKQTSDRVINGDFITKDRLYYEPIITPTTHLIKSINENSNEIFVENVKTFFDNVSENIDEDLGGVIEIISQDTLTQATATSIVSIGGTIQGVNITNYGLGYTTAPKVSISSPVGIVSSAILSSIITPNGKISTINVDFPGIGYTITNPPLILIEPPTQKYEVVENASYEGDFGIISGISTAKIGVGSTGIIFDLFIPKNSPLRELGINQSQILNGYYFIVKNSNVGKGLTSLSNNGSIIGVGTTFIDNVYQAISVSIGQTSVIGIGTTNVAKVLVRVSGYNGLSGIGYSNFYGEYSWGRIYDFVRKDPMSFYSYEINGVTGVNTSPIIRRKRPLKFNNYTQ